GHRPRAHCPRRKTLRRHSLRHAGSRTCRPARTGRPRTRSLPRQNGRSPDQAGAAAVPAQTPPRKPFAPAPLPLLHAPRRRRRNMSEQHATPPCPHFGACGGCQLQHLAYPAQLDRKAARIRDLLSNFSPPELQLHASPPLAYRNRIRLTLREVDGQLRAGYLGGAEAHAGAPSKLRLGGVEPQPPGAPHLAEMWDEEPPSLEVSGNVAFVPITQCPIAAPLLGRAAEAFLSVANNAAWLRSAALVPDQLELFTTADESKLQITLFLRTPQKNPPNRTAADFAVLCESLRAQVPELTGAGIALLPSVTRSRRIEQPRPGPV